MSPTPFTWTLQESSGSVPLATGATTGGESAPRDLELDADGDLLLVEGDLSFTEGGAAVLSDVQARLNFFKDEWFLDRDVGIPYFDSILVKRPDLQGIRSLFRTEILNTEGIAELTTFVMQYDGFTRSLTLRFRATTDLGELISGTAKVPIT